MTHPSRVVVGLSGGVDSAVAALLLQRQGHEVIGLFMKNWEEDDEAGHCSAEQDLADARAVCERLGIPLHTANFSAEYWHRVFRKFLDEYEAGRTPNPDVLCNREIKFDRFLSHARELGADHIATGHYARVGFHDGRWRLLRGVDTDKDQSYFLYLLNQPALAASWFPLGALTKNQVRELAREAGLPVHARKDSTGICFIGERDFREFLGRYLDSRPGDICTPDGVVVGEHAGAMLYTIGQRQGLGIGGAGGPWYVADKDVSANRLVVVQGHDHPDLLSEQLEATDTHWIAGAAPPLPRSLAAGTRYRQPPARCEVRAGKDTAGLNIHFAEPQRAVAPGQAVVLYDGDECLGGGTIERRS
jgi:tRNA-specific 2-thiouridylase